MSSLGFQKSEKKGLNGATRAGSGISQGLTHKRLLELLDYDQSTGVFVWRQNISNIRAGTIAGNISHEYRGIRIDTRRYFAHRLAWFYVYGSWPPGRLDHASRLKDDNRISNLRVATPSQNATNVVYKNTRGLPVGVYRNRSGFVAHVGNKYIGSYQTAESASMAYWAVSRAKHGDFCVGGPS